MEETRNLSRNLYPFHPEPLPTPYKMNSGDIDLGGEHLRLRNWLGIQKVNRHILFMISKKNLHQTNTNFAIFTLLKKC